VAAVADRGGGAIEYLPDRADHATAAVNDRGYTGAYPAIAARTKPTPTFPSPPFVLSGAMINIVDSSCLLAIFGPALQRPHLV
jgi:hypothetical protein